MEAARYGAEVGHNAEIGDHVAVIGGGLVGAWCSMLLDQIIRCTFAYARFRSNKWTKIRV